MNLEDIGAGDKVKYIPKHAHGDQEHLDVEEGIVNSVNSIYAFVKYKIKGTNAYKVTAQATDPQDLILVEKATKESQDWIANVYPSGPAWTGD